MTITTADEDLVRLWEPRASSVAARLRVLKEAKKAGLRTHVMFGPLLPGISDTGEGLAALADLARDADVDSISWDALNARPKVWPAVKELVQRHWPELMGLYRRVMFDDEGREQYLANLRRRVREAGLGKMTESE